MTSYNKMSGNDWWKRRQVRCSNWNERWPTVAAAGEMRMSADDDDQANQQHKLPDPGMAETEY